MHYILKDTIELLSCIFSSLLGAASIENTIDWIFMLH